MRKSIIAAILVSVLAPSSAGATNYGDFGNLNVGDCQYASDANLVIHEFPRAAVTTREVVKAWRANGIAMDAGLAYLENVGFDGHRVSAATPVVTNAAIIAGANHGGIWAGLSWGHVVAIVHASSRSVTVVDAGLAQVMSWKSFRTFFDSSGSTLYALTWASPGTEQINFDGMSTTSDSPVMAPQVEPTGSTTTITPNAFIQDGYAFAGWTTHENGNVAQYRDGQSYTFTRGMTLYALWTYVGATS